MPRITAAFFKISLSLAEEGDFAVQGADAEFFGEFGDWPAKG